MKIFDRTEQCLNKVNFVDENNVLVGYDLTQHCCERAGWFISNSDGCKDCQEETDKNLLKNIEDYRFDSHSFICVDSDYLYSGMMVRFKLVSDTHKDLFLYLFNCHNGYYSHGFEVFVDGISINEYYL